VDEIVQYQRTHGIDIANRQIMNEVTRQKIGDSPLELSVWDFAGQEDYYQNHHYFLSLRTVYLVLFNLSDAKGLQSLDFWLNSLALRLPPQKSGAEKSYSILIVGTFLDHPSVEKQRRAFRLSEVPKKVNEVLKFDLNPGDYFEVSCKTLENINFLKNSIAKSALSHSYMGEKVPGPYVKIRDFLAEKRAALEQGLPILKVSGIPSEFGNSPFLKRALSVLSLWGECVYFSSPQELSVDMVLEPRFLTKGILADLFSFQRMSRKRTTAFWITPNCRPFGLGFAMTNPPRTF
jgi:GTPase SAR1 family protein